MKKAFGTGLFLVLLTVSPAWAISEAQSTPAPVMNPTAPVGVGAVAIIAAPQPLPYVEVPLVPVSKRKTPTIPAFERYLNRPVSELSKLIYLGDMLRDSGLMIVHESMGYDPRLIYPMVSLYVRMNYKNETAEAWIAKHAYRNGSSYGVIYLKDAQGKVQVLRDFLLQELNSL